MHYTKNSTILIEVKLCFINISLSKQISKPFVDFKDKDIILKNYQTTILHLY